MTGGGSAKSWSILTTVSRETEKKLSEIARQKGISRSELLRRIIDKFLKEEELKNGNLY